MRIVLFLIIAGALRYVDSNPNHKTFLSRVVFVAFIIATLLFILSYQ